MSKQTATIFTGPVTLPSYTTTQRDALTPVNSMTIYNTTTNQTQRYENGTWRSIQGRIAVTVGTADADYVCDGVADDIEIQAAINAVNTLGGGTILLRAGTYTLSAVLTLYNNITIRGEGPGKTIVTLTSAITGQDLMSIGSNLGTSSGHSPVGTYQNIELRDMEFNLATIGGSVVALYGVRHAAVDNIYIHDGIRYGVYFAGCDDLRVTNNTIKNLTVAGTYACIQLKGVSQAWVKSNYCYNNQAGTGNQGIDSHASDGVNARNGAYNHIESNYIELCSQGINNEDNDTVISDNTIRSVTGQYGIGLRGSTTYPVVRVIIADNSISGVTTGSNVGISLANCATGSNDIKIHGNYVSNINSDTSSDGITVNVATNVTVQNNTIKNSGRYGIFIRVSGTKVSGNLVYDDQGTKTQSIGIYVDNVVIDTILTDNTCRNNINDGIRFFSGNTGSLLVGNKLTGQTYGVRFLGSNNNDNTLLSGNYFTSNTTANVGITGSDIGAGVVIGTNYGY